MTLQEHKLIISFLESFEEMAEHFCSIKDGKFDAVKSEIFCCLESKMSKEQDKLKFHQDPEFHAKLLNFYNAVKEFIK